MSHVGVGMLRQIASFFIILCLGMAVPLLGVDLPVPNRGLLRVSLPESWKETSREALPGKPPSMVLERFGALRGSLELSVFWNTGGDPGFASEEHIRKVVQAGQVAVRANAVETVFTLKPIQGKRGGGFYYSVTDKTHRMAQHAVEKGEYPILTHGELGAWCLIISFTILSDEKEDAAVQEALAALKSASFDEARKE